MKKITLFLMLSGLSMGYLQAQSLTYSDIINLTGHCTSGDHVIDTVPAGKTWKIQSMAHAGVFLKIVIPGSFDLQLTHDDYGYATFNPAGSNSYWNQPFWLDEGQILKADCASTSTSFRYIISIIEFNK